MVLCVPITLYAASQTHGMRVLRRILDYGLAAGAALLCCYWILEGRW